MTSARLRGAKSENANVISLISVIFSSVSAYQKQLAKQWEFKELAGKEMVRKKRDGKKEERERERERERESV